MLLQWCRSFGVIKVPIKSKKGVVSLLLGPTFCHGFTCMNIMCVTYCTCPNVNHPSRCEFRSIRKPMQLSGQSCGLVWKVSEWDEIALQLRKLAMPFLPCLLHSVCHSRLDHPSHILSSTCETSSLLVKAPKDMIVETIGRNELVQEFHSILRTLVNLKT